MDQEIESIKRLVAAIIADGFALNVYECDDPINRDDETDSDVVLKQLLVPGQAVLRIHHKTDQPGRERGKNYFGEIYFDFDENSTTPLIPRYAIDSDESPDSLLKIEGWLTEAGLGEYVKVGKR